MPVVGKTANTVNAPKYHVVAESGANGSATYGSQHAVGAGAKTVGVYGADVANTLARADIAAPGWLLSTHGTGPVVSVLVANAGTTNSYTNADTIVFSGGAVNATANIVANSTGYVVGVSKLVGGSGFANVASVTATITAATGTGANIVPVLGGRAGRVHHETLYENSSITGDGSAIPPKA